MRARWRIISDLPDSSQRMLLQAFRWGLQAQEISDLDAFTRFFSLEQCEAAGVVVTVRGAGSELVRWRRVIATQARFAQPEVRWALSAFAAIMLPQVIGPSGVRG